MRKSILIIAISCGLVLSLFSHTWAQGDHRIGGGIHYWIALDDIDEDDVDENGLGIVLSYQYRMAQFFTIEADLEFLDEGYAGSSETVFSPQAFFLVGLGLYGGVGLGINYSDGDLADKPFFALRAGFDFEVLPSIFLDLHANYRFEQWDFDKIKGDIDTDTITLGAIVRFEF